MSYKLYSDEEKRLQRKLIPLNILVALLALVAAISLIITPLLKINIGKAISSIGGDGDSDMAQYAVIGEALDAEIEISPLDMLKVLIAPENEKGEILIDKMLIQNGLVEQVSISLINVSLVLATKAVEDNEDLEKLDLAALNDALLTIDNAKSSDDVVKGLDDYLTILEQQLDFPLTDDMKEAAHDNCMELYENTIEATGGEFSIEKMICVNMSGEGGEAYSSYSELLTGIMNGSSESSEDSFSEIADMLNQAAAPYGYAFIYVAFNALIWFILFLFAFFRMFAKNKRFTMWYAKLIGCWPCIIFFLVPFAMGKVAASIEVLAPFAGIFTAISSMTWISGICYLLMWALSIFWAFPIKHKIRKMRKGR